jgi:hypothetical protein
MILLSISFILLGCSSGTWKPDYRENEVSISWVRVSDAGLRFFCGGEERRAMRAATGELPSFAPTFKGCSMRTGTKSCTVYAPEPLGDLDERSFAILGEEVAHCFYGDFHD